MKKEIIATKAAPAAVGPYSQAIKVGDVLYTSGQIALDPETGVLASAEIGVPDRFRGDAGRTSGRCSGQRPGSYPTLYR